MKHWTLVPVKGNVKFLPSVPAVDVLLKAEEVIAFVLVGAANEHYE